MRQPINIQPFLIVHVAGKTPITGCLNKFDYYETSFLHRMKNRVGR